ncbi:glycine N-acyltransferase-like [Brachionichthys hirsutus]|uniref:glycine N-acyltransferase-like n=1 Tax=Brachionichthys hirsutus TaxID=412623 RepID=UPI0036053C2C
MELTGEQLKEAEIVLKRDLPQSLMLYGYLVQINKTHLSQRSPVTVLVDKWPEFSFIMCVPQVNQGSIKQACAFAKDAVVLEETIRKQSFVHLSSDLVIGTSLHHSDIFRTVGLERNLSIISHQNALCRMMILEDVSHLPSIDSSGISLSSLDESHAALVNQKWKFSENNKSVETIRKMLTRFPSLCVLDAEGKPVSWILVYMTCAIGMLYTVAEHRGKGYAKALITATAKWLHTEGYPVYCLIEEENEISYKLFKDMGFVETPAFRVARLRFSDA